MDKDEFFEWWCTRSVADKERLKGEAPAASERVLKLKTKFKLAAMFAGRAQRDSAWKCTVGFSQLQRFSTGLGSAGKVNAGHQKRLADAEATVATLQTSLAASQREVEAHATALQNVETEKAAAEKQAQSAAEELETVNIYLATSRTQAHQASRQIQELKQHVVDRAQSDAEASRYGCVWI